MIRVRFWKENTQSSIRTNPKSWAKEVKQLEQMDFQTSAKKVWSKFKTNQKNSVVCIVLGANPPFRVFEGFIKRVWGNLGVEKIVRMHSEFTLVSFRDEETRDLILETGVIYFDKKPVILRPWTTDMDSARMVKSVPVWVRLNGLGLQYWGENNLSALVSTIGKPIMVDKVTANRTMVKYARVLVDMEISENSPKTIAYINERKQLAEQQVKYEWLPSKCKACDSLGHTHNKEQGPTENSKQQDIGSVPGDKCEEKEVAPTQDLKGKEQENKPEDTNWITPRKKGSKVVVNAGSKVVTRNGYEILLESDEGGLVTNNNMVKVVGNSGDFFCTPVYGSNNLAERKEMFEDLARLGHVNSPWLILGDFNAMFGFQDKNGGKPILAKDIEDAQQ
uniref:DUF4283 domain-containing protein n=1 Tax=Cannabis sativa TaxID=3483 RepID=A0A803PPI9_CANSA